MSQLQLPAHICDHSCKDILIQILGLNVAMSEEQSAMEFSYKYYESQSTTCWQGSLAHYLRTFLPNHAMFFESAEIEVLGAVNPP